MVTNLASVSLSWSDHHLIKGNLTMALLLHGKQEPILMVRPHRLVDPTGFWDSMQWILIDLAGATVEALIDGWFTTATRAVDMIAPKHALQHSSTSTLVRPSATSYKEQQEKAGDHLEVVPDGK